MWPLSIVGPLQFKPAVVVVVDDDAADADDVVDDADWLRLMLDVAQFIEVADADADAAANAAGEDDVVIVRFFMGSDIMEAWK